MKAQLGKPTGLALALLATLLATFLAMGVFSVALANEHSATSRSLSTEHGCSLGPNTPRSTLRFSAYGFKAAQLTETLPVGFQLCVRLHRALNRRPMVRL